MFGQGHRLNQQEADVINSILDQEERNLDDYNNSSATLSLLDDQCRQIWPNWDTISPRDAQKSSIPPQRETIAPNIRPSSIAPQTYQPPQSKYTNIQAPKDTLPQRDYKPSQSSASTSKYSSVQISPDIPIQRDYKPTQTTINTNRYSSVQISSDIPIQRDYRQSPFPQITPPKQQMSRQPVQPKLGSTDNLELQNIKADIDNLFSKIQSISSGNSSPTSSPKFNTSPMPPKSAPQPSAKYDFTSPASKSQSSVLQSPATEFRNAHKDPSFTYQPQTQSSFSFDMNSSISGYMNAPSFDSGIKTDIDDYKPSQPTSSKFQPRPSYTSMAQTSVPQYQPQKSPIVPPKSPNNFDIPISPKQYSQNLPTSNYTKDSQNNMYDDSILDDKYMSSSNLYDAPLPTSQKLSQGLPKQPQVAPATASSTQQFASTKQYSTNQQFSTAQFQTTQQFTSQQQSQQFSASQQLGTPKASVTPATSENEELVRLRTDNFMLRTELMKVKKRLQIEELERKRLEDALEKSGKLIEYYKQQMGK